MKRYGYLRVSVDRSDVDNQRYRIEQYLLQKECVIDEYLEEVESGSVKTVDRKLHALLSRMDKGDMLYVSEISRVGRRMADVMWFMQECANHKVGITIVNQDLMFDINDPMHSIMVALFAFVADWERRLNSERTTQALQRKKASGVKLGRPKGFRLEGSKYTVLSDTVKELMQSGYNYADICKQLNISQGTYYKALKHKNEPCNLLTSPSRPTLDLQEASTSTLLDHSEQDTL